MRPLVFVHGFMGGGDQWREQLPLGETRELVFVDLPGFGHNAHLPNINKIDDFASWVLGDLTNKGIHRFDLLGHSMGGMIVQEMVKQAEERVEKLILYGTAAQGALPNRFETIETSKKRAVEDGASATAKRISATWFLAKENASGYSHCSEIAQKSSLPAILAGLDAMQVWSAVDNLPHIKQETLIVWGDGDRTYAWPQIEQLWMTIPNARLAVLPNVSHAVHAENAAIFNSIIQEFLN